jgi:L-fucose mutarotase
MLKQQLLHPTINEVLARAGQHATVLIADGNFPVSTKKGPNATLVCLNLMPGVVNCIQVLEAVLSAVSIDSVNAIMFEISDAHYLGAEPPVWEAYRHRLHTAGLEIDLLPLSRSEFYKAVETPDHVLTILTAETQRDASLLLSIGLRPEDAILPG